MMDVFSLEDDDANQLFITQSKGTTQNDDINMSPILGDGFDFGLCL